MAPSRATVEPTELIAGDTITWVKSVTDYPATDGWTLSYVLRGPSPSPTMTITVEGADYVVAIAAADGALMLPGAYQWAGYVTKGTERHTIAMGTMFVRPNLALAGKKSFAQCMLEAVEAALQGRIPADVEEYAIVGRSIKKIPVQQLMQLRDRFRLEVGLQANPTQSTAARAIRFGSVC